MQHKKEAGRLEAFGGGEGPGAVHIPYPLNPYPLPPLSPLRVVWWLVVGVGVGILPAALTTVGAARVWIHRCHIICSDHVQQKGEHGGQLRLYV